MQISQNLAAALVKKQQPVKAIYISSYIPRKCGIATFTKHLTTSINNLNPRALAEIIAVTDKDQEYEYPWEVKMRIGQHHMPDYSMAAHYINQSSTDVVNLQHEFGLFGGVDGDYLLPLLDMIDKPLVTNFHTILPEPDEHKAYIMRRIIDQSVAVIAMTNSSRQILIDVYNCPIEKTVMIYHGVPDFTFNGIEEHKKRLKIKADPMILTTGLIGPGKGLEYVIEAMAEIVKAMPKAKLYIVGQTHPHILRHEGESYLDTLKSQVKKLKLTRSVVFEHRYLDDDEFKRYYQAADFFVTAYPNIQQPTSGTLAYGLGSGKICIATPYHYAREVLAEHTGLLVEPRDSDSIAKAVIDTWKDKELANEYRKRAYHKGREMTWPNIGLSYMDLFRQILQQGGDSAGNNIPQPTH